MPEPRSAIYVGKVMHQRLRPRKHRLSYDMFSLLLDLDEIGDLSRRLRFFSRGRFNLFSFHDRDHADGSDVSLRAYVERQLEAAGLDVDGGAIQLFCMPRIFGYAFNPLSIYFCHRRDGSLQAILYEVSNTFKQRHSYLIPVDAREQGGPVDQQCDKQFYVSPFIAMNMRYRFHVDPPGETTSIRITGGDEDGPLIVAAFTGERRALTDRTLARIFLTYPFLTLKVIAGIHWEALLLWIKGVKLVQRPAPPDSPVTYVATTTPPLPRKVSSDVI